MKKNTFLQTSSQTVGPFFAYGLTAQQYRYDFPSLFNGNLRKNDIDETLVGYTFSSTSFWLTYFFIFPVITMRLFAEENKVGTIETLLTAPVKTIHVLLAKYFSSLLFK